MDLPVNKLAAFEFFVINLPSLAMLIFPLDDLTLAGANFKALDKLDFDTPKIVAVSVRLRLSAAPGAANAAWILLLTMALTSATDDLEVIEGDGAVTDELEVV